ncbi:MAG TPA: hypothetical protein VL981_12160, partial [Candidatus Methylacidiphilales bacterium]|nr:hypothetical protein [Candidatus Methylacidiphilales bacterium]
ELMPAEAEIPRYLGGAMPAGLEVNAADLAIALKAAAGTHSVRRLALELNLDEIIVRYTIARLRAAGLVEIIGRDDTMPDPSSLPPPSLSKTGPIPGSPNSTPSGQPRYWRGRKI